MPIVKVSPGGQVRVPKEVMERLSISTGDYLDFEFVEGNLIVKAKKLIDADQAWFWSKWQEAEKAVEEDIKQGRVSKIFSTSEEGITYLRKRGKSYPRLKDSLNLLSFQDGVCSDIAENNFAFLIHLKSKSVTHGQRRFPYGRILKTLHLLVLNEGEKYLLEKLKVSFQKYGYILRQL